MNMRVNREKADMKRGNEMWKENRRTSTCPFLTKALFVNTETKIKIDKRASREATVEAK